MERTGFGFWFLFFLCHAHHCPFPGEKPVRVFNWCNKTLVVFLRIAALFAVLLLFSLLYCLLLCTMLSCFLSSLLQKHPLPSWLSCESSEYGPYGFPALRTTSPLWHLCNGAPRSLSLSLYEKGFTQLSTDCERSTSIAESHWATSRAIRWQPADSEHPFKRIAVFPSCSWGGF